MGPFELHPVNPDGGRHSVAVLFLGGIVGFPERLQFAVVGLPFLDGKLADGIRAYLQGHLAEGVLQPGLPAWGAAIASRRRLARVEGGAG